MAQNPVSFKTIAGKPPDAAARKHRPAGSIAVTLPAEVKPGGGRAAT